MKSGDIESVTFWPGWKLCISEKIWLIAKIIQMLFCYCQQKLIQCDAYSSIFNKCITKFGNSIPGWGSSFQVQLTWLEEKKNQTNPHCGKWFKCIVKLKNKKRTLKTREGISLLIYETSPLSTRTLLHSWKSLWGKKKRTKSPKYKDTLKRGIFFPIKHKKAGVFKVQYCNILTILNL